jgi:hypothetical protein
VHASSWAKVNPELAATALKRTAEKQRFFHNVRVHTEAGCLTMATFQQPHNISTQDCYVTDDDMGRQSFLEPIFIERLLDFRGTSALQTLVDVDLCYQSRVPLLSAAGTSTLWCFDFWAVRANVLWQTDGKAHFKSERQRLLDRHNGEAVLAHNEFISSHGVPRELKWFMTGPYKLARVHFADVLCSNKCKHFIDMVLRHANLHKDLSCVYYSDGYTQASARMYREHALPQNGLKIYVPYLVRA